MAQKFNPATGQWEDDTTTSTGGDPTTAPFLAGDQVTAATVPTPTPAPFDRSQGGVQQTQSGYSPVVGADLQTRQAGAGTSFTNANTGASAHYDPATGMYIDANGQSIRPDAIRTSDPAQFAGQPSASAPAGATAAGGATSDFQSAVRQLLMEHLRNASMPVDPNSPEIAATLSSASDAGQRASDAERTALAERLYAQGGGLNTDALTRQVQQSGEKQAGTLSTLKGQLLMNAYNRKAEQLQQDLQLAIQSGDAEATRQAQMAIANLQATVQRESLGVNLSEFGAQLNQNAALAGLRG